MKKVIYIAVFLVGLLAVSCSKESIRPCTVNSSETPVWRSADDIPVDVLDTEDGDGDGGITDPNNDPDENSRKRN